MPPVGFEPAISAGERPKTYALDRAAQGPAKKHVVGEIKGIIFHKNCGVRLKRMARST